MKRSTLFTLIALGALGTPADAQRLIGLDTGFGGGGAAGSARLNLIATTTCQVPSFCTPMLPTGPITNIPAPYGGNAYENISHTQWFTDGPTLRHVDASCAHIDSYAIPGPNSRWMTGLAIAQGQGILFFTTTSSFAEMAIPPSLGGVPGPLPAATVASVLSMPAPGGMAPPLLAVEHNRLDDTLWILDSQFNVANVQRPSAGGAVISFFNVAPLCGGMLQPWPQGLTLAPGKQVPGHPPGVIYISDDTNHLLQVDFAGNPISCCAMGPLPNNLVGLALTNLRPSHIGRGCSRNCNDPVMTERGIPYLGNRRFQLGVKNAPAPSTALMLLSFQRMRFPFGCGTLEGNILQTIPLAAQALQGQGRCDGEAYWPTPIPNESALEGLKFIGQAVGFDANGFFFLSDAAEYTIQ